MNMVEIKVFGKPNQSYTDALERYAVELEIKTPLIQLANAKNSKELSTYLREFANFDEGFDLDKLNKIFPYRNNASVSYISKILRRPNVPPTIIINPKIGLEG